MAGESPQNLYAKNLQQPFGYPLRSPEPKPGLPSSYAEHGLNIGDIGYVNDHGMFEVLFNICFAPDHTLHYARRKDLVGLVGLTMFDSSASPPIPNGIPVGRAICHGIEGDQGKGLDLNLKSTEGHAFKSSSTSGAILILPSGAVRQDLDKRLEEEFRELAETRALDWCKYARCKTLYLITGFHKTRSWFLASFCDVKPGQILVERDKDGRYTCRTSCDYRQSLEGPGGNDNENQTVFITGFRIEVRGLERHAQVVVEKLTLHPRSIWSELILQVKFLFAVFLSFLQRTFKLRSHDAPEDNVNINRVPASSQPFHPSDIINRYLLDKNPDVQVAITHDNKWLEMIETNELSLEDMMEEERFWTFLDENYTDDPNSNGVVYIRRKTETGKGLGRSARSRGSPKRFSAFTVPDDNRQFVVAHMRAENIVGCLRRMPIGFYVMIQFNGTRRRSKCKPAPFRDDIVEWDDEIMLPTDPTVNVQVSIVASFEFEPILGNGETLCMLETNVGKLSEGGSTHFLSSLGEGERNSCPPSLLITLEERGFDPLFDLGLRGSNLGSENSSCIEAAEVTDKGRKALYHCRRGEGAEKLLESVECFKLALSLCPPDHECHAVALFNHATASFMNAQAHAAISDLKGAIDSYRKALKLRPSGHPDHPATLLHLAHTLCVQHEKLQCEASIADEIEKLTTAIRKNYSEDSYPHRAASLVVQTLKRCQAWASGELAELEEWTSEVDRFARMSPDWHFDRPYRLINVSIALRKRFEIKGHLDYLEKSISMMEEALQLVSDSDFDRPWMLASLGDALCARFAQCGNVADLARSISMIEDALKLTPEGHFDKPRMLAALGNALGARFVQHGVISDLENSISMIEDSVKLAPDGHSEKPLMLASLGGALCARCLQRGDVTDLDRSISMLEDAVKHAPEGHFDKPRILASLGDALFASSVQRGVQSDLENSLSMIEDAVKLAPDGHFEKHQMLASLSNGLRVRFIQRGDVADLDRSICMIEDAVKHTPDSHFDKPRMLASFGNALRGRFVARGDLADLDSSICIIEDAVKLVPDTHVLKAWVLTGLGFARFLRFFRGGVFDLVNPVSMTPSSVHLCLAAKLNWLDNDSNRLVDCSDVEQAISRHQLAAGLLLGGDPYKADCLINLASSLFTRFWCLRDPSNLEETVSTYKDAVELLPAGNPDKPLCLINLFLALLARFEHFGNLGDLEEAISRRTDASKLAPDVFKNITPSAAMEAFSACLGDDSPMKAIELLDEGRGVHWGYLAFLSRAERAPAGKLTDSPGSAQHDYIEHTNVESQSVVAGIRESPGLPPVLSPSSFPDLQQAASEGPIIVVNASKNSCDALIVLLDHDPIHIPLKITRDGVLALSLQLRAVIVRAMTMDVTGELTNILWELWDQVVSPIVDILRTIHPLRSRIWWCPTGEFCVLPLHAAGAYRGNQPSFSDLYISSYTTTLAALVRARAPEPSRPANEQRRFVAIGQADATEDSNPALQASISQHVKDLVTFTSIEGKESHISRVSEELQKNEWVHLACRGLLNRDQPFESAFRLHDGHLTIKHIIQCKPLNSQFAYLATVGGEERPNEMIHLAAAMQFAGFRSVIGTMWVPPENDQVTSMFYDSMIDESGRLDHTRAASALHKTMETLSGLSLFERINYIHLGA